VEEPANAQDQSDERSNGCWHGSKFLEGISYRGRVNTPRMRSGTRQTPNGDPLAEEILQESRLPNGE